MTPPKSNTEAQADYKARVKASKGKVLTVVLSPAAASKLAAWVARGETIAGVVNRLLTRSKP